MVKVKKGGRESMQWKEAHLCFLYVNKACLPSSCTHGVWAFMGQKTEAFFKQRRLSLGVIIKYYLLK